MPVDEVLCLTEGVLCAEADDLDVWMLASELLDLGGLPVARRSVGSPEPEPGVVALRQRLEVDRVARRDSGDLDIGDVGRRRSRQFGTIARTQDAVSAGRSDRKNAKQTMNELAEISPCCQGQGREARRRA